MLVEKSEIAATGEWTIHDSYGGTASGNWSLENTSKIDSEGHPGWNALYPRRDVGGPFYLDKTWWTDINPHRFSYISAPGISGTTMPIGLYDAPSFTEAHDIASNDLMGLGTTAFARSLPTNSIFEGLTAIGESIQQLPSAPLTAAFQAKHKELLSVPGDEYLNIQFGWLPMVSDIKNFAYAVKHHNEIIRNYEANSDTRIRRRYVFPPHEESVSDTRSSMFASAYPENSFMAGTMDAILKERTWFAGSFRYHVPMGSSVRDRLLRAEQEANKLLGLRLTPEVLWNLTPYSWMADWFSNAGDVFHNISALSLDGLVAEYAYIMRQSESKLTLTNHSYPASATKHRKICQRLQASPYGFDLEYDGLSTVQKAIIAALGLSRGGHAYLR